MNPSRMRRNAQTDAELVAGAAAGDEAMFRELYQRHAAQVYARLTRLVGAIPDRDDLVQQVFIAAHRALPTFRNECAFSTLLYQIVVHTAYDSLRRARRAVPTDDTMLDAMVAPDASPEVRAQRRQELARMFDLLGTLKPKKRIAFVLVAVEGLSLDEAAALVGAKPQAVKQRVLAARRELAAAIEKQTRNER